MSESETASATMTERAPEPLTGPAGADACPYCHAAVAPERAHDAPFVCPRCGAVRVAAAAGSGSATQPSTHVEDATLIRTSTTVWKTLGLVTGPFAIFSALLVWLVAGVTDPPVAATLVGFTATMAALGFAGFAWMRARTRARTLQASVDRAWQALIVELAGNGRVLDSAAIVAATRLSSSDAERFVRELTSTGRLVASKSPEGTRYTVPTSRAVVGSHAD